MSVLKIIEICKHHVIEVVTREVEVVQPLVPHVPEVFLCSRIYCSLHSGFQLLSGVEVAASL